MITSQASLFEWFTLAVLAMMSINFFWGMWMFCFCPQQYFVQTLKILLETNWKKFLWMNQEKKNSKCLYFIWRSSKLMRAQPDFRGLLLCPKKLEDTWNESQQVLLIVWLLSNSLALSHWSHEDFKDLETVSRSLTKPSEACQMLYYAFSRFIGLFQGTRVSCWSLFHVKVSIWLPFIDSSFCESPRNSLEMFQG